MIGVNQAGKSNEGLDVKAQVGLRQCRNLRVMLKGPDMI